MNKQTITSHIRCFYDVSFPLACSRRAAGRFFLGTARQITGSLTNRKGRCNATERTHCKTSAPTDGAIDTSTFRNNKFIHIKTRNNYGTENFNDELSGSTVERQPRRRDTTD